MFESSLQDDGSTTLTSWAEFLLRFVHHGYSKHVVEPLVKRLDLRIVMHLSTLEEVKAMDVHRDCRIWSVSHKPRHKSKISTRFTCKQKHACFGERTLHQNKPVWFPFARSLHRENVDRFSCRRNPKCLPLPQLQGPGNGNQSIARQPLVGCFHFEMPRVCLRLWMSSVGHTRPRQIASRCCICVFGHTASGSQLWRAAREAILCFRSEPSIVHPRWPSCASVSRFFVRIVFGTEIAQTFGFTSSRSVVKSY